jgi:phage terminase small subunit
MLTPKQEQFVKNIVLEQMNYTEAYRNAYNAENMSDKTISEKASRLKDQDKVRARIKELSAEIVSPKIMTVQQRAERLTEFAQDEDRNVAMKAIDLLNKMTGEYIQRVSAEVDASYNINIELVDEE